MLGQFATELLDEGMKFSPDKDVVAMINDRISSIDSLLSDHLNAIMHHPTSRVWKQGGQV